MIENHESRAGRTLVNRGDELGHEASQSHRRPETIQLMQKHRVPSSGSTFTDPAQFEGRESDESGTDDPRRKISGPLALADISYRTVVDGLSVMKSTESLSIRASRSASTRLRDSSSSCQATISRAARSRVIVAT